MKRKLHILALSLLSVVTCGAMITSTVAWFKDGHNIAFGNGTKVWLGAGTEAFYFASGDGSIDDPYTISNRNQLYNLAWLQYIGYFNLQRDSDNNVAEPNTNLIEAPHFVVTADIDMDGITLPPIGTEKYPFFGEFDGGGYTISNLTISNADPNNDTNNDFGSMKPNVIPARAEQPKVVGFFGAVGYIPTNSILQESDYSSKVATASNFKLENLTVKSRTSEVLIGLAAGYVDGDFDGITIGGDSQISVNGASALHINETQTITNNLSDYGLVGYTTKTGAYGEFKQQLSKYYDNENENQSTGDDWGGSIDFSSTFKRLGRHRTNAAPHQYVYLNNYLDDIFEDTTEPTGDRNRGSYSRVNENTGSDYYGSFNVLEYDSTRKYCLGGAYVLDRYYETTEDDGYYITDGTNYLVCSSNGSLSNTTDSTTASVWKFTSTSGTAYISTTIYSFDSASTTNNGISSTTYYLRNNNNSSLVTTTTTNNYGTNPRTNWTLTTSGSNLSISSNNYHIVCYNNNWTLMLNGQVQTTPPTYYRVVSSNNYISSSLSVQSAGSGNNSYTYSNVTATTSSSDEVELHIDDNNYVYCVYNSITYYLALYVSGSNGSIRFVSATRNGGINSSYYRYTYNSSNGLISASYYGTSYYLRYNNSRWTFTDSSSSGVSLTAMGAEYTNFYLQSLVNSSASQDIRTYKDSSGHMEFTPENTTYFPINAYKDDVKEDGVVIHHQDEPTLKNTGYIVGGSTRSYYNSDMRSFVVSGYTRSSKIPVSVDDDCNISNVKTIVNGEIKDVENDFPTTKWQKYYSDKTNPSDPVIGSKENLEEVLKNDKSEDKVYGLHFISMETSDTFSLNAKNVVDATNVLVNGERYSGNNTYQLPAYSIDFNLKQQGYINFFAGSYNGATNNDGIGITNANKINSFFSLHQVFRDSHSKISKILEIKAIYSQTGSSNYVYSYKKTNNLGGLLDVVDADGNSFTATSDMTLVFDTDWIGYQGTKLHTHHSDFRASDTLGSLYYFEIPVNAGEFCLANVRDDSHEIEGCYLIYLDIGAAGAEDQDHITAYTITTHINPEVFPTGVDFAITGIGTTGGETACIVIPASKSGSITFIVDDNYDEEHDTDGTDTIDISDSSGISSYSYVSETVGTNFLLDSSSEDPPGEYSPPEDGTYYRKSYIRVETITGGIATVVITDTLDKDGNIVTSEDDDGNIVLATTYDISYTYKNAQNETVTVNLDDINTLRNTYNVNSLNGSMLEKIRALITVVTLMRNCSSSATFDTILPDLPWTTSATAYDATIELPAGYVIAVEVIKSDANTFTIMINGTPITLTLHAADDTHPNQYYTGSYTQPNP